MNNTVTVSLMPFDNYHVEHTLAEDIARAERDFSALQTLAAAFSQALASFREDHYIEEDTEENDNNNFAYLDEALDELMDAKLVFNR